MPSQGTPRTPSRRERQQLTRTIERAIADAEAPADYRTALAAVWAAHGDAILDLGRDGFQRLVLAIRQKDLVDAERVALRELSNAELIARMRGQTAKLKRIREAREARLALAHDLLADLGTVGLKLLLTAL